MKPALAAQLRRLRKSAASTPLTTAWHLAKTSAILFRARFGHLVTRAQQHGRKTEDTVWAHAASRSFLATPVERFRSTDAAQLSLNSLLAALQTGGVPHRVIASPPERSQVVVDDLARALASIGRSPEVWYGQTGGRTVPVRGTIARANVAGLTLFRTWATPAGQFLAASDVDVELLTEAPPSPPEAPDFPIDAVFTWVDGEDPVWQQRKLARQSDGMDDLHGTAANAARYASIDELKYALRSIEMYAPWFRHIFLVTDRQIPEWLDVTHPRVTVVDHREIFDDPGALPTFNSHAIEARLHHIHGLAEHYVYFNDDVFLAQALPPSFFFEPDGRLRVFLAPDEIDAGPVTPTDSPVVTAAKNNRDLLRTLAGYELRHKLKHVPHPQLRSLTLELENRASGPFHATASAPFRTPGDLSIASSLLPHYALATGRGVEGSIRHFYADVASHELRWRLPVLHEMRGIDVLCLNATIAAPQEGLSRVSTFLEDFLPSGASWERVMV